MNRKQQGFTLLEIMLVVSIIVIILGVAISKLGNTTAIAKTMRVQADVQAIKTQLQLYESMNGFYPTTEQGLQALVTQPDKDPRPARWYQLFRELPKDPWGNDYIYRSPGLKSPSGYDLYSAGPDRQADTARDRQKDAADSGLRFGRRADAGGGAVADADGQDVGRDRRAARGERAVHVRAHESDDRRRFGLVCHARRRHSC